ncbi:MAG TPA: hypothetical protein VMW24_05515 [Sedimentisphaerales bacterium]|nr:hypothetical protein [Sedimentisphaerales bacterium]
MRGRTIISRTSAIIGIACVCLLVTLLAFGCKEKTEPTSRTDQKKEVRREDPKKNVSVEEQTNQLVFDMEEVSVFDLDDEISRDFLRGQTIFRDHQAGRGRPGQYPHFNSAEPIHGMISFAGKPVGQSPPRMYYHLAIDESVGTGTGYDRLYFDRNGDGDLADEKPLMPVKDPPKAVLRQNSSTELQVCFESFEMTFDFGSAGKHALEIMTRLIAYKRSPQLTFFPTKVRRGEIEIGGVKYYALLGYDYSVGHPFDEPGAVFLLIPQSGPEDRPRWSGADQLNSIHAIGGEHYRFATTPLGDKLFVRPYDGELGTFEVGPGGRDIQEVSILGSLRSENTAVAVGDGKPIRSCRLPEGDYLPAYLTMTLGHLRIDVSNNYHADGKPRGPGSRPDVYGIKIRRDRPYVFDISNKPNVLFASPAKDKRIKLGEELTVRAVLIDPELDIMVRGLDDTSRKEKKEFTTPDGRKHTIERAASLDPKVVITRANGEQVADGVMPFG